MSDAPSHTQSGIIIPDSFSGDGVLAAMATRRYRPKLSTRHERMTALADDLSPQYRMIVCGGQVHGDNATEVTEGTFLQFQHENDPKHPVVIDGHDAFFTTEQGLLLALYTADCVPVVLYDPNVPMIGVAHAGWRGTYSGIARNLAQKMIEAGANPDSMRAWIAPAISLESYEVSEEIAADWRVRFDDKWSDGESDMDESLVSGRHINLPATNSFLLTEIGIPAASIIRSEACTLADEEQFYSYRRDGQCGGHLVTIAGIL